MNLDSYHKIISQLPNSVTLIAVSKGQSIDKILKLYSEGQRHFGENFEQELTHKKENLPEDIKWHFLGNMQTNTLKRITSSSYLIQSVSRTKEQFEEIAQLYNDLKSKDEKIATLSIGMSSDYNLAIQSGSNMIRLGTVIFGKRK